MAVRKRNSTSFKKGKIGGRKPGSQNKLTRTVKETVLAVVNEIQEDPRRNLNAFAKKYPRDFHNIAARLIPTELVTHFDKVKIEIVRKNNTGISGPIAPGTAASDNAGTSL